MTRLPKLLTRRSYLIIAVVVLLPLIVTAYWLIRNPAITVAALPIIGLIELFFVGIVSKSMTLDAHRGAIVTTWLFVVTRNLVLGQVHEIDVRSNGAGSGNLVLRTPNRLALVPLIHLSTDVKKSRDAAGLIALAEAIQRFVPESTRHRDDTVQLLQRQAAWTGALEQSPLGPFVSTAVLASGEAAAGMSIFTFLQ